MPPYVPRKRSSPAAEAPPPAKKRAAPPSSTKTAASRKSAAPAPKKSLFDTLDAPKAGATAEETRALLATLGDDDSELSDVDSDDFEDVPIAPPAKRRRVDEDEESDGDESDEMDFEDVDMSNQQTRHQDNETFQDINISINDNDAGEAAMEKAMAGNANIKKGPSKRDRQIRIRSHMMHVQALVFHNAVRNSWLNDNQVQQTLVAGLSEGVKKEVDRWKIDMGYTKPEEPKKGKKGKRKSSKTKDKRDGRDWGIDADRLESGAVNMSRGDPLMRLLKVLTAYWKKRFTVTAPGIRKIGYMPLRRLAAEVKDWVNNKDNMEEHGERIDSLDDFRKLAKECEGSRDVGAQLFTALIRGLGIEARMVASLQPVGFGWSKAEDAAPKKSKSSSSTTTKGSTPAKTKAASDDKSAITISDGENDSVQEVAKPKTKPSSSKPLTPQKPIRSSTRGSKTIVDQSDSSDLSSLPSEDDASIIDITPTVAPASRKHPTKKYDRDLSFPHYWSEVLSPVSNTYIPVDSIVLSTVASNPELLSTFEPRGKSADQAKQVICYTLAYNPDSTAKDVTIRYLKRHQMPGRTKGFRIMPERVPIYNKRGKVLRHEEQDWFATVILPFLRPSNKQTEADSKEDATDLKPFKPANAGETKQSQGEESLQWYKQSAEFVLERFLRREEALLPHATPVREFKSGKGDKAKTEPVYNRADVVSCKTVESWHKEGRNIKIGEHPLKMVPVRAVTLIRKREMENVQRETGEKLKQGLYSIDQTEWIIPDPIGEDRAIPKNAFGNMDCYVPSMVPRGAVHVKLKGCAKLCRKLDIDYAEACVGFEFGKQRAVPVIFGVVVAEENQAMVKDAWRAEQEIQRRKADVKREAMMLHLWRKFVMGLRIVERMKAEYRDNGSGEEVNPFVNRERQAVGFDREKGDEGDGDEVMRDTGLSANDGGSGGGGGFFLPGQEEALLASPNPTYEAKLEDDDPYSGGGGFMADEDEDEKEDDSYAGGEGFILGDGDEEEEEEARPAPASKANGSAKPMSLQSAHRSIAQMGGADEDDNDEDEGDIKPVQPKPRRRAPPETSSAKSKPQRPAKSPARKPAMPKKAAKKSASKRAIATPSETDEASVSDLTDLSSASGSTATSEHPEELSEGATEDIPGPRARRIGRNSPRVLISPPKMSRIGSVKSRYFRNRGKMAGPVRHDEDENENEDYDMHDPGNDVSEEDEEEEEVVRPRRTTARTRKSLA